MTDWAPVARCEIGAAHIVTEPNPCPNRFAVAVVVSHDNCLFMCEYHATMHTDNVRRLATVRAEEQCTDPEEPAVQEPPC